MSVLEWSDRSLPRTPSSFSQAPGPVPTSTPADGGGCRIALEEALDRVHLNRWGADAGAAYASDAGPGLVRGFPLFEHGAGI